MKTLMSKLVAAAAAAVIAVSAFAGCSDYDEGEGPFDPFSIGRDSKNGKDESAEEQNDSEPEKTVTTSVTTTASVTATTSKKKTTTTTTTTPPPIKKLDDPQNFTAKLEGTDLIIVWDEPSGANAYDVSSDNGETTVRSNTVTLYGVIPNSTVIIKVRALEIKNGKIIAESNWQSIKFDLSKIPTDNTSKRKGNELTDNGDSITRKIEWLSLDEKTRFWTAVTIKKSDYEKYSKQKRLYLPSQYINYINEPYNRATCKNIADAILKAAESQGYTKSQTVHEAIRFVQSIPYKTDIDSRGQREYPKYPVETIYEDNGDCEDLSMLLLSIIREMGFQTCFIEFSDHIGVGILGADGLEGAYYEVNGRKYYYVETTDFGWKFGQIPERRRTEKAVIHEIPM